MKHSYLKFEYPKKNRPKSSKHIVDQFVQLQTQHQKEKFVQKHELELAGIPSMLNQLNYHFQSFQNLENKAQKKLTFLKEIKSNSNPLYYPKILPIYVQKARYEIEAYVNTLGKIETFIKSWWVNYLSENAITNMVPTLLALMPLRNKCYAHRSFDEPRGTEQDIQKSVNNNDKIKHLIESHLEHNLITRWRGEPMCLSYEIVVDLDNRHRLLKAHHPEAIQDIEYFNNDSYFLTFIPSKHHKFIINELSTFISNFFSQGVKHHP